MRAGLLPFENEEFSPLGIAIVSDPRHDTHIASGKISHASHGDQIVLLESRSASGTGHEPGGSLARGYRITSGHVWPHRNSANVWREPWGPPWETVRSQHSHRPSPCSSPPQPDVDGRMSLPAGGDGYEVHTDRAQDDQEKHRQHDRASTTPVHQVNTPHTRAAIQASSTTRNSPRTPATPHGHRFQVWNLRVRRHSPDAVKRRPLHDPGIPADAARREKAGDTPSVPSWKPSGCEERSSPKELEKDDRSPPGRGRSLCADLRRRRGPSR